MRVHLIDLTRLTVTNQKSIFCGLMNRSACDSVFQSCVTSPTVVLTTITLFTRVTAFGVSEGT